MGLSGACSCGMDKIALTDSPLQHRFNCPIYLSWKADRDTVGAGDKPSAVATERGRSDATDE